MSERQQPDEHDQRMLFNPPSDIHESEDGLILEADLPGVSLDTPDLKIEDNKLTLFGRAQTTLPDGARPVHQEYHVGDFLRSIILSDNVDHERITARLANGVLRVELPKAEQSKPRRIEVSSGE